MATGRIVFVDDDFELSSMVEGYLEDEGYEVATANDGEEGLETILSEQPDLVILDVMMPGMNGWELARYMREREAWNDTPILMLTAIGEALNEVTSPLYGADDHMDKPFELDDLLDKVRGLLAQQPGEGART